MSASKDRILRKQQIEAGTDKRSIAAAEEAKKRRKTNITYTVVAVLLVIFFAFIFYYNSALPARNTTAVTIDGEKYSVAQTDYFYSMNYMNFYSNYADYIQNGMFFNPQESLADQMYSEDTSWRQYFLDSAVDSMTEIQVLNKAAEEAGFVLPEEDRAEYEDALQQIRDNWSSLGYSSLKQYLNMNYGKGVTMDMVEEELLRSYIASAYLRSVYDGYEYTDEELDAYYAENAADLDVISYVYYSVTDDTTDAQAIADAVNGTDEETFTAYLADNLDGAAPTSLTNAGSSISELYADWLMDPARTAGDAAAFTDETNDISYAVMFLDHDTNDYAPVSFRHILINAEDADGDGVFSQEEIDAAEARAQEIYDEWLAGEATEESFGELANTYSTDGGSNTVGGLYETVVKNQMVPPINEWLFDEARQPGDTTVVTYDGANYTGAHVVYFVGTDEESYADQLSDNALRNDALTQWLQGLKDAAVVTTSHMKMCGKNH